MEEVAEAALEVLEVQEVEVLEPKLLKHHLEVVTIVLIMTDEDDTTVVTQAARVLVRKAVGILELYLH